MSIKHRLDAKLVNAEAGLHDYFCRNQRQFAVARYQVEGAVQGLSMLDRFASEERDEELQAAIEAALEALTVVLNLVD